MIGIYLSNCLLSEEVVEDCDAGCPDIVDGSSSELFKITDSQFRVMSHDSI